MPKKEDKEDEYYNQIFRERDRRGGTNSYQPGTYWGFKYIRQTLELVPEEGSAPILFSELKKKYKMIQVEEIPLIVFVQLRLLELKKSAGKLEDRTFVLGNFGKFLKQNYLGESNQVLALAAFLLFSIFPFCIYDIFKVLNKEYCKKFTNSLILEKINPAKKTEILESLGIFSTASGTVYSTIPLFFLVEDEKVKKIRISDYKILKQAAIIALDFAFNEIYIKIRSIRNRGKDLYLILEDIFFYLVRPEVLLPEFNETNINETNVIQFLEKEDYPYSGMFFFLRGENQEEDDYNQFLEFFNRVYSKNHDVILREDILDSQIKANVKNKDLAEKITLLGRE